LEFSLSADWALQNGWNEETDWLRDPPASRSSAN
jgi:hypothetical protein